MAAKDSTSDTVLSKHDNSSKLVSSAGGNKRSWQLSIANCGKENLSSVQDIAIEQALIKLLQIWLRAAIAPN